MPARLRNAVRTVPDFPQKGILFRDITPILASRELVRVAIAELTDPWLNIRILYQFVSVEPCVFRDQCDQQKYDTDAPE